MNNCDKYIKNLEEELSSLKFEENISTPKISIIIPAYNVENYIAECLFSIIKQSFKNFEILIVDDGATDRTNEIIKIFSKFDNRIKLIEQKNQGAGTAKNNALNQAIGKYIIFVDSDDVLLPDALKMAYDTISQNKVDVVVFGAEGILEDKKVNCSYGIENVPNEIKNKILTQKEKYIFKLPVIAMCKIYDREFLVKNSIYFQTTKTGEDQIFHIKAILLADKIFILDKNLYGYRKRRKGSLTSSKKKKDNSVIYNFYAIKDFLQNTDYPIGFNNKVLNKYFIKSVSWLGKCADDYRKIYFQDLQKLCEFVSKNYPQLYNHEIEFSQNDTYWILKIKLGLIKLKKKFFKN